MEEHRFFIELPGEAKAHLDYKLHLMKNPPIIEFTYTFVSESYRNQGIASKMVAEGLEYADKKGYEVEPTCPFVASYMEENVH